MKGLADKGKHTDLLTPNGVRATGNVSRVSGKQIRVLTSQIPMQNLHPMRKFVVGVVAAGVVLYAFAAPMPESTATKAMVIDELSVLRCEGRIVTPEYLFNTVVTNGMYDPAAETTNRRYSSFYDERYRCFVDLNQDGHDDLILSDPTMQRGSGGLSYVVYLWTNGNYREIGEIGTHPACLHVEHIDCTQRTIWTYWHSSGCSGSIGAFRVSSTGFVTDTHIDVDLGSDGQEPTTIGLELYNLILRKANVPIRTEISCTTNGVVRWRKFNMGREYR